MQKLVLVIGLISSLAAPAAEVDGHTVVDNSPLCYNKASGFRPFAFFQELLLPQCEMKFPCADVAAEGMVACLQTRASINFQLKTSQSLRNFFDQQQDLQDMFVNDSDYKEVFQKLHLKDLYSADAGVYEQYTIAQHTTMALVVYESQSRFWGLDKLTEPSFVTDKPRFLKHLVAYHDIGKGIPAKLYAGDRRQILAHEIQYSYPIAWRVMLSSKYSRAEATFAISLIATHKVIGDFLQSKIDLAEAKGEIDRYAKFAGTNPKVFLQYLEMLFVADAGAYPGLKDRIFDHSAEGHMTIKDQMTYQILKLAWN